MKAFSFMIELMFIFLESKRKPACLIEKLEISLVFYRTFLTVNQPWHFMTCLTKLDIQFSLVHFTDFPSCFTLTSSVVLTFFTSLSSAKYIKRNENSGKMSKIVHIILRISCSIFFCIKLQFSPLPG